MDARPATLSARPERKASSGERSGFALIVTIILISFLVLLMVSMAALTRVETQIAANYQKADQARQNALMALNVALGKLQATAGPDQRVTATADLLAATDPTKKNWTGVWNTTSASPTPTWLVSSLSPAVPTHTGAVTAPTTGNADATNVRLVGSVSANTTVVGNDIIVPLDNISAPLPGFSGPQTIGKIGYWVGDEGVKANINLDDPNAERIATTSGTPSASAVTPTTPQKRQSQMIPGRIGAELLATDTTLASSISLTNSSAWPWSVSTGTAAAPTVLGDTSFPATGTSASSANFRRDLAKLLDPMQVELLNTPGLTSTFRKARFYDFTLTSRGVLADVLNGGLKKDLTAGLLGSTTPANATSLITIPATATTPMFAPTKWPSWGALRSYVQLQNTVSGANPTVAPRLTVDNTTMGISPIIERMQFWVYATRETSDQSLRLLYFPAIVLWNPYDVTLAPATYSGQIRLGGNNNFQVLAEMGPAAAASPTSYKYGAGTLLTSGRTKGFVIDCSSTSIAPGEALIFTPDINTDSSTATPAQLILKPGWRTNFWYERVTTTNSTPVAPTGTDVVKRLILTHTPFSGEGSCFLYLGANFTGNNPSSSANLLQYFSGLNLFSGNTAVTASPGLTWPTSSSTPAFNATPAVQIASLITMPAGLLPTATPSAPAVGCFGTMKFSNQPNNIASGVTKDDSTYGLAWLAQYNPAAPGLRRTALENAQGGTPNNQLYGSTPNFNCAVISTNASAMFSIQSSGNNAFNGYSADDITFSFTKTVLFHLPRAETGVLSIGALQHANVHPSAGTLATGGTYGYCPSAMPAYAIGNSYVDPRVLSSDTDGFPDWGRTFDSALAGGAFTQNQFQSFHFDLSYLLNKELWDKYYFSTVPTSGTPSFPLANSRHALYDPNTLGAAALATTLKDYDKAASRLLVTGAFNINSTSREAWRALLASTRNAPVIKQDGSTASMPTGQFTPIARTPYPFENPVNASSIAETQATVYAGFRSLTDAQIDALAVQIVAQNKARAADTNYGPFRSMSDFVNRRPAASVTAYQLSGPLQAAIDATSINGGNTASTGLKGAPNLTSTSVNTQVTALIPAFTTAKFQSQAAIARSAATPGFLTQADLLQILGPVLSARSDTFRIRAYGDVRNPATASTTPEAQAWCEAIVQRVPDYVDPTNAAEIAPSAATPTNQTFGRRFKIVSFKWLSPSDL